MQGPWTSVARSPESTGRSGSRRLGAAGSGHPWARGAKGPSESWGWREGVTGRDTSTVRDTVLTQGRSRKETPAPLPFFLLRPVGAR